MSIIVFLTDHKSNPAINLCLEYYSLLEINQAPPKTVQKIVTNPNSVIKRVSKFVDFCVCK